MYITTFIAVMLFAICALYTGMQIFAKIFMFLVKAVYKKLQPYPADGTEQCPAIRPVQDVQKKNIPPPQVVVQQPEAKKDVCPITDADPDWSRFETPAYLRRGECIW